MKSFQSALGKGDSHESKTSISSLSSRRKADEANIGGNPMQEVKRDVVLTTDEVVQYFKLSKTTILKYVRLGRIKATKAGRGWKFLQSDLDRFFKG